MLSEQFAFLYIVSKWLFCAVTAWFYGVHGRIVSGKGRVIG